MMHRGAKRLENEDEKVKREEECRNEVDLDGSLRLEKIARGSLITAKSMKMTRINSTH